MTRPLEHGGDDLSAWQAALREHDAILPDDAEELEAHVRESAALHVAFGASAPSGLR